MKDLSTKEKIMLASVFIICICAIGAVISIGLHWSVAGRYMVYGMAGAFLVAMSIVALDTRNS